MNAKKALKKTALALLLIVTMVCLLLPLFALPAAAAMNVNLGNCYQVDPRSPIVVDGRMDEAYRYGFHVMVDLPSDLYTERDTFGVAYFAWSGSSIYCYVIVNDDEILPRAASNHWQADCVELYIHRGDDVSRDYPTTSNPYLNGPNMPAVPSGAHAGRQSGRQYRIDGFSGEPSCYLFGEDLSYSWSEAKGRFYSAGGAMVTDDLNAFGWYEGGFARHTFASGPSGYAVEYKIDFDTPLRAGEKFRFDLMISDRYGNYGDQENIYYASDVRLESGAMVSNINNYDHFTLSDVIAYNDGVIDDEELYDFGRYDDSWEDPEWPDDPEYPDNPEDDIEYDTVENGVYYLDKQVVYCDPEAISVSLRSDTVGIAEGAFAGCLYLEKITIPSGVTGIGDGAFALCVSLKEVTFAAGSRLASIGEGAFMGCAILKEIAIPSSVTSIGDYAFEACLVLKSVAFQKDSRLQTIGAFLFSESASLEEIVIPSSVTSIDPDAFTDSSLEHIYYVGTGGDWARMTGGKVTTNAAIHFSPCYFGHTNTTHKAKEPSCTESGWESYVSCLRCGYSTYEEKKPLGHKETHYAAKAPTCAESGYEAYVTCSRCDYTTYREIPALLHAPAEEVVENRVEPSCVKMGGYDSVVYCSVCKKELSRKTNVLNLIGHDEVAHEAKAPTCTEIGWDAYVTCTRCDFSTRVEKPAFDHDWDEGDVVVKQTCTTPWMVLYSCQRCEEEKLTTLNGGALAPHVYDKEVVDENYLKSPATESEGAVYYKSCVCGEKGDGTFTHGDPIKVEPPKDDDEPASGCGGNIGGTGVVVILSLGIAGALRLRKRKEE